VTDERDDAEDIVIARALGVEEGTESVAVDADAVREYREVLAHMPFDEVAPPTGLEDRVIAAAMVRRSPEAVALDARRRNRRRSRLAFLAAAAAAVIAVLAIVTATRGTTELPNGQVREVTSTRADINALLDQSGARTGRFDAVDGKVVLTPEGRGAIYDLDWSAPVTVLVATRDRDVSLGSATPENGAVLFNVEHPELVERVVLQSNGIAIGDAKLSP
jgi:hypothetical protein